MKANKVPKINTICNNTVIILIFLKQTTNKWISQDPFNTICFKVKTPNKYKKNNNNIGWKMGLISFNNNIFYMQVDNNSNQNKIKIRIKIRIRIKFKFRREEIRGNSSRISNRDR